MTVSDTAAAAAAAAEETKNDVERETERGGASLCAPLRSDDGARGAGEEEEEAAKAFNVVRVDMVLPRARMCRMRLLLFSPARFRTSTYSVGWSRDRSTITLSTDLYVMYHLRSAKESDAVAPVGLIGGHILFFSHIITGKYSCS